MKKILLLPFCLFLLSACYHDRNNFSSSDLNMGPGQTNLQLPPSPSGSGATTNFNTGVRSGGSVAPSSAGTGRVLGPIINPSMSGGALGTIGAADVGSSSTPSSEIKDLHATVHFTKIFDGDDSFFGGGRLFDGAYSNLTFKKVSTPAGIQQCYIKTHIKMESPRSPSLGGFTLQLKGIKENNEEKLLEEWGTENIVSSTRRSDGKYDIIFEFTNHCASEDLYEFWDFTNISDYSKYRISLSYPTGEGETKVHDGGRCPRGDSDNCPAGQLCDEYDICYRTVPYHTPADRQEVILGPSFGPIPCTDNPSCGDVRQACGYFSGVHFCYWKPDLDPPHVQDYLELNFPSSPDGASSW